MLARIKEAFFLTRGEKSVLAAYATVAAMTTGLAVTVTTQVAADGGFSGAPMGPWVLLAGAASGALALFAARGWMGSTGALGTARACVGAFATALLAALIAGTLIQPIAGTFYAPVLLLSAFINLPWLALICFAVLFTAHLLLAQHTREIEQGRGRHERRASAELSSLSQVNLYRHHYRG